MLLPLIPIEDYSAATSYTNAKEFYETCESVRKGNEYHAETVNGTIYYATKAKLASSGDALQYHTVGFDIELKGNGSSVAFAVQRTGGSMREIDKRKDKNYEYILYAVEDEELYRLAQIKDPVAASKVLDASKIDVRMDAILVTKQRSSTGGGIREDGQGGFSQWGTIYRLKNSSDLYKIKNIFQGHEFKSYCEIWQDMDNYLLQIRYNVQGLDPTASI